MIQYCSDIKNDKDKFSAWLRIMLDLPWIKCLVIREEIFRVNREDI